ncbi:MAG: HK97 family phage prohead protease [Methanosarcinales archaeon]|nr:HK97 family phage prohead protease [Methanosarcinales archaeon]
MPYDSNDKLPEAVRNSLEEAQQTKWREVFNGTISESCDDACASKIAWSKLEKNARWFSGWASVEVVDRQADLIEMKAFESTMDGFMKMGGTLIDQHSNRKVGAYIDYEFKNKNDVPALWVKGVIYRGHRVHDDVWTKICNKEYPALSIGADPIDFEQKCNDKICWNTIKTLDLFEISAVEAPANQEATIEHVNYAAKADNYINKSITDANTSGDSMAEETKPTEEPVEKTDGVEPVAEPTEKSNEILEAVKAMGEMVTSLTAEVDTIKAKVFPSEEEEDEPEEEEEDKEKSLTLPNIKKAIREELKILVKDQSTSTPRPELKKHELDGEKLTKALTDRTELAGMSIRDIDALVDEQEMPGVKPW